MKEQRMWFAVDAHLFYDPFIRRLRDRYGPAGTEAWIALLAAAKMSTPEGVVRFAGEADGWRVLGLADVPRPSWSLDEFFHWTGLQQKTRRTRRGGMTHVSIRRFDDWQRLRPRRSTVDRPSIDRSLTGVTPSFDRRSMIVRPSVDDRQNRRSDGTFLRYDKDKENEKEKEIEIEIESDTRAVVLDGLGPVGEVVLPGPGDAAALAGAWLATLSAKTEDGMEGGAG